MTHNHRWTNIVHFNGMMTHEPKFKICKTKYQDDKEVCDFYLSQNYGKVARLMVHCVSFNLEANEILKNQKKKCAINVVGLLDRDLKSKNLRILVQNLEIAYSGKSDLLERKKRKNGDKDDSD